ncbi:unnamed protein product, partial [Amoebophrya sp. A25]
GGHQSLHHDPAVLQQLMNQYGAVPHLLQGTSPLGMLTPSTNDLAGGALGSQHQHLLHNSQGLMNMGNNPSGAMGGNNLLARPSMFIDQQHQHALQQALGGAQGGGRFSRAVFATGSALVDALD